MELIAFPKMAGEELFRIDETTGTPLAQQEQDAVRALTAYIASNELDISQLAISFDSARATVTLTGTVADQQAREKIILCCGNVEGVAHVDDQTVAERGTALPFQWHTARTGDTLPEISKKIYGDASKYMAIFEANTPMLTHPDKVYLGQVLRVPPGTRKCFEPVTVWRKDRHRITAPAKE